MPASPIRHPPFPRLASAARSWLAALPAAIAVVLCLHPFLSSFASFTRGPSPVRLRRLPFLFSLLPLAFTLPPFVASLSNHKHLTPRSLSCHAHHSPRRRNTGERWYPVFRSQRAPHPAKMRPAATSKSFLEKTLIAREAPRNAPPPPGRIA